ncbi:hypothetical protein ACFL03_15585 [Thermodesulfobacteriota bacterium]
MKRHARAAISTKIEANKDKVYRASDIHDIAGLIFTNKNAKALRTAFILIFLSIKYSQEHKLTSHELEGVRQNKAPEVSQKTLWKARATMARIGIITRRDGIYWQFATKFGKSLNNLAEKTGQLMVPNGSGEQAQKEWFLLECSKGMQ